MSASASLRAAATSLDAYSDSPPTSMRDLATRIRWDGGWQGSGPLSVLWLLRTYRCHSLRSTFERISDPPPVSVRDAYQRLGFPLGGGVTRLPEDPISLRDLATRINGSDTVPIRFLSYNAYLLQGLQVPLDRWIDDVVGWDALKWFGIPFGGALLVKLGLTSIPAVAIAEILKLGGFTPSKVIAAVVPGAKLNGITIKPKPALEKRGDELGPVVAQYDVSCLCEVWTQDSRTRIAAGVAKSGSNRAWQYAVGPDENADWTLAGSGLLCAVKGYGLSRTKTLVYTDRGGRVRDTDAWSHKGAMLSVIETPLGDLELFQTHLYYGGGLPAVPEPTHDERTAVWAAELAELTTFFQAHHEPGNVAILTGDFNMDAADLRTYAQLRQTTDALNLRDLWAWDVYDHSPCGGRTCRYTDLDMSGWERGFEEACEEVIKTVTPPPWPVETTPLRPDDTCADAGPVAPPPLPQKHASGVGRYDYVFVEHPNHSHRYRLEVSRIRRRPFPRPVATDGKPTDHERYLSDHLGLDITLYLSAR